MKIATLQLSSPKMQREIKTYLDIALEQKVKIVLFGEYFFNPFFKVIERDKKNQLILKLKKESENLMQISNEYPMIFVAPLLELVAGKIYKSMAIINKGKALQYRAQRLMPYEHWNEAKFFANTLSKNIKTPPINDGGVIAERIYVKKSKINDFLSGCSKKGFAISSQSLAALYLYLTGIKL